MHVFVTGGSGYLGSAAIRALHAAGPRVEALARSPEAAATVRAAGAVPVHGSTEDPALLRAHAAQADAIVHCAFGGTAAAIALEAAALHTLVAAAKPGAAVVYTSGAWVYGSRGDAVIDEDAPLAPLALVAFRPAHEAIVLDAAARGLRGVVVRPGIVYGDGRGMVGRMVEMARRGETIQVAGDGANRWPLVRVDALAELFVRIVEHSEARGVYNAQTGAAVPYVEIARAASRAGGGDGSVDLVPLDAARAAMGPFADALACDLQLSCARAERDLGWHPHRPTVLEELSGTTVV